MGTIAEKLSYLDGTREQILTNINALGGDLTEEDTFRSYANELDNIWEELPHTTGTGTSLSLATKSGKMKVNLLGNTSQYTTTGKNLLPNDVATKTENGITITKYDDGTYKLNGTATADLSTSISNDFIPMTGTWRMLGCPSGGSANTYMLSAYVGYWGEGSPNIDTGNGTNITYTGNVKVRFFIKSGTTCNNLIFKPMLTTDTSATIDSFEPYTNGASPNPDYPQEVHVVSGDNTINVTGKNLWGEEEHGGIDESTGQNISNANRWRTINYVKVKPNTTYTLSSNTSSNIWYIFYYYDKNKNFISSKPLIDTASVNWATPSNCEYMRCVVSDTPTIQTTERQLELGSTATTYEPYTSTSYPVHLGEYELCKIGEYQDRFIRTTGKNLLDNLSTQIGVAWNNAANTARAVSYIKVEPNKTYSASLLSLGTLDGVYYFGKENATDSTATTGVTQISTTRTFTTTSTTNYIGIQYNKTNITQQDVESAIVMLNEGSTALPYEPYGTNEWYLEKKIGKVVLDGSESWNNDGGTQGNNYRHNIYYLSRMTIPPATGTSGTYLSNYFGAVNIASDSGVLGSFYISEGWIVFTDKGKTYDLAGWKNWLSTHNTVIYYALATPTYTQITGTLKDELEAVWRANSYKGTTNVSQVNNDLPFNLSVTALGSE